MVDFPHATAIRLRYLRKLGRLPNLREPTRFTEKVQIAKLKWRNPLMPILADKVQAKEFVANRLGPEWVTPNLFAGPRLPPRSERNWAAPYAIKANHRSGKNIFVIPVDTRGHVRCVDRDGLPMFDGQAATGPDWGAIEAAVSSWLSKPHAPRLREWAYSNIKPMVLVEPFLGEREPPIDYKLFVFGGRAELILAVVDRFGQKKHSYRDRSWKPLHFGERDYPNIEGQLEKPPSLDRMIRGAELLGEGFPFVQIDLYEIAGLPRFSEVTFYPNSGITHFEPPEWDEKLGRMWPKGTPR